MSADEADPWNRVTVRMPQSMIDELDDVVDNGDAQNRSVALRECVKQADLEAMFR